MEFPSSISVKQLQRTASDYDLYSDAYTAFAELFEGGAVLRNAVLTRGAYLMKKPQELGEVFAVRQERFSYTNLLGTIVGWYVSALFKNPPQLVKKRAGLEGEAALKIPSAAQSFCEQFEKDADRAGTAYIDFWRKVFQCAVLHKSAYVLMDLPSLAAAAIAPNNLQQQRQAGLLNPYLVMYTPSQVISWDSDSYGNLTWCVIHIVNEERTFLNDPVLVDYWYFFDQTEVALYECKRNKDKKIPADAVAFLVDGYPRQHATSDLARLPIRKIELPDGLWLANRVFLPLLNHLNLDNGYDFGLFNAALAQLWIKGEYDDTLKRSEIGWIQLAPDGDIGYLEPEGKAFSLIDQRLQTLEERIYKSCYLMDQARTNRSTPTAQSGISKQQDKTPSRDALSGLGDVIRPAMQLVYGDVLAIAGYGEDIVPDIRGFDFEDKAGSEEMDFMEKSTVIDVQSDVYRRERDKKFVRIVLPDANQETLELIDDEIDANPTPEAAAAAQAEEERAQQLSTFQASLKGA